MGWQGEKKPTKGSRAGASEPGPYNNCDRAKVERLAAAAATEHRDGVFRKPRFRSRSRVGLQCLPFNVPADAWADCPGGTVSSIRRHQGRGGKGAGGRASTERAGRDAANFPAR